MKPIYTAKWSEMVTNLDSNEYRQPEVARKMAATSRADGIAESLHNESNKIIINIVNHISIMSILLLNDNINRKQKGIGAKGGKPPK